MSELPITPVRLTADERERLLAVGEAQGASGYTGGVRAALVLAEQVLAARAAKAMRTAWKKGAVSE